MGTKHATTTVDSVDVVVVTYNSAPVITGCLDAIAAQSASQVGVIIVDNASADNTLDLARQHPIGARVFESGGNFGYSAAINIGVEHSDADAVLILNPDTVLGTDAIEALSGAVAEVGAGIAAPMIENADGSRENTIRRFPSCSRLLGQTLIGSTRAGRYELLGDTVTIDEAYTRRGTHDWCSGAVLLVTSACLDRVGRWDESFFLYSEETDFSWRARNAGFETVFVPDAVVEHIGGDSGTSPRLWSILATNRVHLVRKHRGRLHATAFWAVSVLGELLRSNRPIHRAALTALVTGRTDPAVVAAQAREAQARDT